MWVKVSMTWRPSEFSINIPLRNKHPDSPADPSNSSSRKNTKSKSKSKSKTKSKSTGSSKTNARETRKRKQGASRLPVTAPAVSADDRNPNPVPEVKKGAKTQKRKGQPQSTDLTQIKALDKVVELVMTVLGTHTW